MHAARLAAVLAAAMGMVPVLAAPRPAAAAPEEDAFAILAARPIPDGRAYAPFYTYVIGPQVVVEQGVAFCVFQNALGRPIAMAWDPQRQAWAGPVQVADFGLKGDDHGNPALAIDRQGFLHVFYGCHGGPMRHARSERPRDLAAWTEQPPPVPRATYPQAMRMADGRLFLFYRAGGHTEPWSLVISPDDGRTWGPPQPIIEMRRSPPDPLAAAYAFFFPGADRRTVHVFWNHKDDNAARVSATRPHPWRPLKYPGLHEAVYRYNVYYLRRETGGQWRSAARRPLPLPVGKADADAHCLVYDSGDEFTMIGMGLAVDPQDRPYLRFGTGVVDWVRQHKDPKAVLVPPTNRFAAPDDGRWTVAREMPPAWPEDVRRILAAPGPLAYGQDWPGGHFFIHARRRPSRADLGCAVFLLDDRTGHVRPEGGPAKVE